MISMLHKWWTAEKADVAAQIFRSVEFLRDRDIGGRRKHDERHASLYGGTVVLGFTPTTYARLTLPDDRITMNVIKPIVDTATAKIASKNPPKPMFLTTNGEWELQRRAKKLGALVDGLFYLGGIRAMAPIVFRDAMIFGTGCVKVYERDGRVAYERVLVVELLTNDAEGIYGTPRSLYQIRFMSRDVMKALYPKKAEAIAAAKSPAETEFYGRDLYSDQVEVVEAWHLPSGPDADDGRHVVCVENAWLRDEEWTDEGFPFAFLRWNAPLQGFYGIGAVRDLREIQIEINRMLRRGHEGLRLFSIPRVFAQKGTFEKRHLRGDEGGIADIIEYAGSTPPLFISPTAFPPEFWARLDTLYQRGFELIGITQLSATGLKPAGLTSRPGLITYHDIETERFATQARGFEEFHLELARLSVKTARAIYDRDGEFRAKARAARFLEDIDWKDVNLDDDAYQLQVFPASALPQDPGGRFERVQDLIEAQFITPEVGKKLLDFPDIEAELGNELAPLDYVDSCIEKMLGGKAVQPESFGPLEMALERVGNAYLSGVAKRAPRDRLALLRNYMQDLKALIAAAAPAPAVGPPPPAGANGAIPMEPGAMEMGEMMGGVPGAAPNLAVPMTPV